jgi:hypothetical protein
MLTPHTFPNLALVKHGAKLGPRVPLFGYVRLIAANTIPGYTDFYAIVDLRDTPGKAVAVITSEQKLQNALHTAFVTGNLIEMLVRQYVKNPGFDVDAYSIETVTVYPNK